MLVRASAALVIGDLKTLNALCGVKSAKEEAQEEAEMGVRMVKGDAT